MKILNILFFKMKLLVWLVSFFPILTMALPAHLSFSGAGSASLKPGLFYLLNPALLSFNPSELAMAYSFNKTHQTGMLALVDRKTRIPLGITYHRFLENREFSFQKVSVTWANTFRSFLSVGVTVHRYEKVKNHVEWNGDTGAVLALGKQMAFSLVLKNILLEKGRQRVWTAGFFKSLSSFLNLQMDLSLKPSEKHWFVTGGFETLFYKFLSLKGGGFWSFRDQKPFFSGGVGLKSVRLNLEYGFQLQGEILEQAFLAQLLF